MSDTPSPRSTGFAVDAGAVFVVSLPSSSEASSSTSVYVVRFASAPSGAGLPSF